MPIGTHMIRGCSVRHMILPVLQQSSVVPLLWLRCPRDQTPPLHIRTFAPNLTGGILTGGILTGGGMHLMVKLAMQFARLDQKWDMFSPHPAHTQGWLVFPATLSDGRAIDLWRNGAEISCKPAPTQVAYTPPEVAVKVNILSFSHVTAAVKLAAHHSHCITCRGQARQCR